MEWLIWFSGVPVALLCIFLMRKKITLLSVFKSLIFSLITVFFTIIYLLCTSIVYHCYKMDKIVLFKSKKK